MNPHPAQFAADFSVYCENCDNWHLCTSECPPWTPESADSDDETVPYAESDVDE